MSLLDEARKLEGQGLAVAAPVGVGGKCHQEGLAWLPAALDSHTSGAVTHTLWRWNHRENGRGGGGPPSRSPVRCQQGAAHLPPSGAFLLLLEFFF